MNIKHIPVWECSTQECLVYNKLSQIFYCTLMFNTARFIDTYDNLAYFKGKIQACICKEIYIYMLRHICTYNQYKIVYMEQT